MIIDNSNKLIKQVEGIKSREKELNELNGCLNTALYYKKTLEDLINLDFNNPSEFLLDFSSKNNVDLKDENIQKEFFKIRDEHIEKVNDFYYRNFGGTSKALGANPLIPTINKKSGTNLLPKKQENKEIKIDYDKKNEKLDIKAILNKKNNENNEKKIKQINKNQGWSMSFSGIVVLSVLLIYYIINDIVLNYYKKMDEVN